MKQILVPIGCRSDEGLSAPVIKRLKEHFSVDVVHLIPQDFLESYSIIEWMVRDTLVPYDLILITGDRVEMCAAAAAAFHNKIPIAHFYAGIINDPITTFDDVDRHAITLWSDIQFCESEDAAHVTHQLITKAGLNPNVFITGISHLDDIEINESKVPEGPYDLLLINGEPLVEKSCFSWSGRDNDLTIQIGSNPDEDTRAMTGMNLIYYDNLPRPQFLGLLKNCRRFITNSSCSIYEAPHFLKPGQIVMVGDRNKNRPKGPFQTGASDRIVEILKEYLK